jgi:hypothetical protein
VPSTGLDGRGALEWNATMVNPPQYADLNNHHRNTLRQILGHPASHNIEWRAVLSLLEAVGSVVKRHDGRVAVTLGSETEVLDPAGHKDIDTQTIVDLRRMLTTAGYADTTDPTGDDDEG